MIAPFCKGGRCSVAAAGDFVLAVISCQSPDREGGVTLIKIRKIASLQPLCYLRDPASRSDVVPQACHPYSKHLLRTLQNTHTNTEKPF